MKFSLPNPKDNYWIREVILWGHLMLFAHVDPLQLTHAQVLRLLPA